MKIDTQTVIRDFSGAPIEKSEGASWTIRDVIQEAVMTVVESDRNRGGEGKATLMRLALRAGEPEADYTAEETVLLKERIGEVYGPLIVGRAFEILDPR